MPRVGKRTLARMTLAVMVVCAPAAGYKSRGMLPVALGGESDGALCSECDPVGAWQVCAESLFLTRNRAEWMPFTGVPTSFFGDVALLQSTKDLGFDYEPGMRLSLTRQLDACTGLELAYFGLHEFDSASQRTDEFGELLSPFCQFTPFAFGFTTGFDGAHVHRLEYGSDIHNAEVNVRHQTLRGRRLGASWLAGLRYVRITEDFVFESLELNGGFGGADAIGIQRIGTKNDLIGAQVGYELAVAATDRLLLGAKGNAGLFVNVADHESAFIQDMGSGAVNRVDYGRAGETLAGLIDVGLFAAYQVGSCLTLRAGYDVLFFSGLALAPEQFDINIGYFGSALNDSGTTVYHGPSAGFIVVW